MSGFPGEDRPLVLSVWGITDVGRSRSDNQDTFLIVELSDHQGTPPAFRLEPGSLVDPGAPPVIAVKESGLLLLVADGMGGAAGGATASRMAVEGIADTLRSGWAEERVRTPSQFVARIRQAVEEANLRVHRRSTATPELFGMGTTATVAGILDGIVYLAQVGDSRGYLVRNGRAVQLTRDQSVVQELVESGALTAEEAERSPHRSVLLQALGTSAHVDVALTWHELRRGDRLVLCSDGLSGPLSDADIAATVAAAPSPDRACEELVRLANERGGPDNITAIVARIEGGGVSAPGPEEEPRLRAFAPGSA